MSMSTNACPAPGAAPENKSADPDVGAAFEEFNRAFAAFRETNDERLHQMETRIGADPLTQEKLARIDTALDEQKRRVDDIAVERARPRIGGGGVKSAGDFADREHKAAFNSYVRGGEAGSLRQIEEKALSVGSPADGGYLVPVPAEAEILRRMAVISPIRSIATVTAISTAQLKKAFSFQGPASGWVGEADPSAFKPSLRAASRRAVTGGRDVDGSPASTRSGFSRAIRAARGLLRNSLAALCRSKKEALPGRGAAKWQGFRSLPAKSTLVATDGLC